MFLICIHFHRNRAALSGRTIAIEGRSSAMKTMARNITESSFEIMCMMPVCTLLFCGDTCCNSCGSNVSLSDDSMLGIVLAGQYQGKDIGCSGNECSMACNPQLGARYRATGTLRFEEHGDAVELILHVQTLVHLPD